MMKDDDFKLLKGFALRRTDERTNGQTFAIVESLSRLKNKKCGFFPHLPDLLWGTVMAGTVVLILGVYMVARSWSRAGGYQSV